MKKNPFCTAQCDRWLIVFYCDHALRTVTYCNVINRQWCSDWWTNSTDDFVHWWQTGSHLKLIPVAERTILWWTQKWHSWRKPKRNSGVTKCWLMREKFWTQFMRWSRVDLRSQNQYWAYKYVSISHGAHKLMVQNTHHGLDTTSQTDRRVTRDRAILTLFQNMDNHCFSPGNRDWVLWPNTVVHGQQKLPTCRWEVRDHLVIDTKGARGHVATMI